MDFRVESMVYGFFYVFEIDVGKNIFMFGKGLNVNWKIFDESGLCGLVWSGVFGVMSSLCVFGFFEVDFFIGELFFFLFL